ncbi:methyltransferase-like 26 [Babylonia areolata]|uniref:methyltransferase-like 26 n=1 Tax=Babylonia areolata TaxID=304850 RepID=UPI003FD40E75
MAYADKQEIFGDYDDLIYVLLQGMADLVKGLGEVKDSSVNLISFFQLKCGFVNIAKQLCFTRSSCLEAVLFWAEDTVALQVRHDKQEIFGDYDDLIRVPAADRNKGPILEVLQQYLKVDKGFVLEVASGPGQHVAHFAPHFPSITFQPSDCDVSYLKSIQAYINKTGANNVLHPLYIDITQPVAQWPDQEKFQSQSCNAIININMIHISPWDTCKGLMEASGYLLKAGGFLYMYGPVAVDGVISPESNVQFDQMLRSRNSSWGLRDVQDIKKLAEEHDLQLSNVIDMPANNKSMLFLKR